MPNFASSPERDRALGDQITRMTNIAVLRKNKATNAPGDTESVVLYQSEVPVQSGLPNKISFVAPTNTRLHIDVQHSGPEHRVFGRYTFNSGHQLIGLDVQVDGKSTRIKAPNFSFSESVPLVPGSDANPAIEALNAIITHHQEHGRKISLPTPTSAAAATPPETPTGMRTGEEVMAAQFGGITYTGGITG